MWKSGEETTTITDSEFVYLAASMHQIYSRLNRSIRSRVEGYRSQVNHYLLHKYQQHVFPIKSNEQAIQFLHVLSIGASFPPMGIQPSLDVPVRRTLLQSVISMQERAFPTMEYWIGRCVEGLHRQLQDHDILIFVQKPSIPSSTKNYHDNDKNDKKWKICVVDSYGKSITHLDVIGSINQPTTSPSIDIPLRRHDHDQCYHFFLSSSTSTSPSASLEGREEVENTPQRLHVKIVKRQHTVLYEETISLAEGKEGKHSNWPIIIGTGIIGIIGILVGFFVYFTSNPN